MTKNGFYSDKYTLFPLVSYPELVALVEYNSYLRKVVVVCFSVTLRHSTLPRLQISKLVGEEGDNHSDLRVEAYEWKRESMPDLSRGGNGME